MKKIILIAGLATLAACKQQPAPEPTPTESASAAAASTSANGSPAGSYDVTAKDGTKTMTTLAPDGTYTDMDASGKVTAQGTWAVKDGKTCFTPTTAGVDAMCYTESAAGPDGTFTATPDKGDPVTVKPAAPAAAPSAAPSGTD